MNRQPRWTQTWLGGVRAAGADLGRPGERLGLPASGPGSVSGFGRRIGAVLVDWIVCTWAIGRGILGVDPARSAWVGLLVFALEYLLLAGTTGMTLGMLLFRIKITTVDGKRAPFPVIVLRTLLLCLAVPALIWDRDNRGLHDRASRTVVVHS
ncbi:RDD family protein [Sphaerisporangium aureirubrum]|uniref:RDD family protein n=1 Tax=Sphaerisporangium aureirubrum TaxID=1544736 RepID=A0ABW1NQP7_9ACTN